MAVLKYVFESEHLDIDLVKLKDELMLRFSVYHEAHFKAEYFIPVDEMARILDDISTEKGE